MLLITRRPEPDPGSSILEDTLSNNPSLSVRKVELSPLSDEAERQLAEALVGQDAPTAVIDAVRSKVEGNPLFLEERLFSLLDADALVKESQGWRLDESVETYVPEVLERLIRSRVDRRSPLARQVIVAASVLGREFGLPLLIAVSAVNIDLDSVMAELCATGLVQELRQHPFPIYRFRHALIQEAIYGGILRGQRRQLHYRAALTLEEMSADQLKEAAAIVGQHHAAAGEVGRAAHFLELAGDHAAGVYANEEAISSYRSALMVIGEDHSEEKPIMEAAIDLRTKLAEVLWHVGRQGEAREVLHKAIKLVDSHDSFRAARLLYRLGRVELSERRFEAALTAFYDARDLLGSHAELQEDSRVNLWLYIELEG
ncbi:MAG: hypothetical protein OK454_04340, partial [Thaumarchaeota archaeon]|nr:hypothetical protein [Nitrososphaerota archaeon]